MSEDSYGRDWKAVVWLEFVGMRGRVVRQGNLDLWVLRLGDTEAGLMKGEAGMDEWKAGIDGRKGERQTVEAGREGGGMDV